MKVVGKCSLTLDAPLHIHDGMVDQDLTGGKTPPDQLFGAVKPVISTCVGTLTVSLRLVTDITKNPLVGLHQSIGIARIDAELSGEFDYIPQPDAQELDKFRLQFDEALFRTARRLVEFFRFRLGNPLLRPPNVGHRTEWSWSDESGKLVLKEVFPLVFAHFPGQPGTKLAYGSQPLKTSQLNELTEFLECDSAPDTIDSIRASARDALLLGNVAVAVLQMAILAEVVIKNHYFRRDPIVSEAYDFLEEKRQVEVTSSELINQVAARAFGEKFSAFNKDANLKLEYLFRCRNKVAHRGMAVYRDEAGKMQHADEDSLRGWWESIDILICWLAAKVVPVIAKA